MTTSVRVGKVATTTKHLGDYFVVMATDGRCWTGLGWSDKCEEAQRFDGPLHAYSECEALALSLRHDRGFVCDVAFIPRSEILVAQVPGL